MQTSDALGAAASQLGPDAQAAIVELNKQGGLLQGKSIGFLPTRVHVPDEKEAKKNGWGNDVSLVIDEWLLLEYACVFLPANQDALVESVAKGLPADALLPADDPVIAFTAWEEVERAVERHVSAENIGKCLAVALKEVWERAAGRV